MPKETKRFINPLLRPSVEVEAKKPKEAQVQSEPQAASTRIAAEIVSDTFAATSTETSTTLMRESLATHQAKPDVPSIPIEPQTIPPQSQTNKQAIHPSTETSTYHAEMSERRESHINELSAGVQASPSDVLEGEGPMLYTPSAPTRYADIRVKAEYVYDKSSDSEPVSRSGHHSAFSPAPIVPSLPAHTSSPPTPHVIEPNQVRLPEEKTFASSLPQTSTFTHREQEISPIPAEHDELVTQEYYTSQPPRRRRGAQSFEKTHERITVWIDKRLKQAFEELAYAEETSKTALLNEAVADLLRKYTSR